MKKEKVERERKPIPSHWYFISITECVLCGNTEEIRERRFDKRPEKWEDRHEYNQTACWSHFL